MKKPFFQYQYLILFLAIIPILLIAYLFFYIPIYPDEIGYQFINSRFTFAGLSYSGIFPQCLKSQNLSVPWFQWPARILTSGLYYKIQSIFVFRITGILSAIGVLAMISATSYKLLKTNNTIIQIIVFILFFSIGVNPFIMIFNRPEMLLLMIVAWLAFICFYNFRSISLFWLSHFFFISLFYSLHPKSLVFLPLIILSTLVCLDRKNSSHIFKGLILSLLLIFTFQSYNLYSKSSSCPESTSIAEINSSQYLTPTKDLIKHPSILLKQATLNIASYSKYITDNNFKKVYPVFWLPSTLEEHINLTNSMNLILSILFHFTVIVTFIVSIIVAIKGKQRLIRFLPLSLTISTISLFAIQTAKHFYELPLIWGIHLVTIVCILLLTTSPENKRINRMFRFLLHAGAGVGFFSLILLFSIFAQVLTTPPGYTGPNLNIVQYNHKAIEQKIEQIKKACPINPSKKILVDDIFYFPLKKFRNVSSASYFSWASYAEYGTRFNNEKFNMSVLKSLNVGTVFQDCASMNSVPVWKKLSHAEDGLCCFNIKD